MRDAVFKLPPCPHIICVPRLCGVGVGPQNLPDEGEDPNAICNHDEGVPLGHALLYVQEVAWPVPYVPYHQCLPVAVAVKSKLRATRPLVTDIP